MITLFRVNFPIIVNCIFMLDYAIFYSVKMIEFFFILATVLRWEIGRPIERYLLEEIFFWKQNCVSGVSLFKITLGLLLFQAQDYTSGN